jgi:phosphoribosyl-AMP cyclohydrolase
VSIAATPEQLAEVRYDEHGLVPAIAQDVDGTVLMMAWMNAETLQMTLAEGRMVYWSRSRQEIWRKGDTSGDHQLVREAWYDCDADVLLFKVEQIGNGACHTGARSCFFRRFGAAPEAPAGRASASEPDGDGVRGRSPRVEEA